MADTEVKEILSSFAAGCLDKENFIQFKKYMESGGNLPKGELGELQNLISLVPIILETENPAPILKNKLAKNLVRIQREKSQTLSESKQSKSITLAEKTNTADGGKLESRTPEKETIKEPTKKEETKVKEVTLPPVKERFEKITEEFSQKALEETPREKKTPTLVKIFIVFLILLAAASILLNILWKTDYENEVAQLKADLASLNAEVQVSGKFVTDYRSLIEFLNQPDVAVVNLRGSDFSPQTTGKIFFGFANNQLLIEIKNPKTIQMNETLQLWVSSGGSAISLGTFNYNPAYKFLEIKNIQNLNKNLIDSVTITVEPRTGSDRPTGPVYLSGSL